MARMNVLADVVKGLKANIHAVDNLSPVSRVAIYVNSGSRYEPDHVPGIAHCLRASAGLTTQDSSIFGITRHMERAGAKFSVTSNREYIIYRVDCLRDKLGSILGFLDDTIHKPEFRSWELVDVVQPRMKEDLQRFKKDQTAVTNEALYKAAYRGGLAHSVFSPEHQVEKITKNDLLDFVESNYVLERMSIAGLGVDENELRDTIEQHFRLNGSQYKGSTGATRYVGGEARIQANFPHTMVNFVYQGFPISDMKNNAALLVLASLLGGNFQKYIKYGDGPQKSLGNLLGRSSPAFRASIVHTNHLDTGLFGFSIVGPKEKLKDGTKDAIRHMKQVASEIKDSDLTNAKKAIKTRALLETEDHEQAFLAMGHRFAAGLKGQSPVDSVAKLTLNDVKSTVQTLFKSKPTLVSVGNPRYVPYIDEIDS